MKILKQGDPKKQVCTIRFSCRFCGCIFEVDNGECDRDSLYAGNGRVDTYSARCPNCYDMCARSFAYDMQTGKRVERWAWDKCLMRHERRSTWSLSSF